MFVLCIAFIYIQLLKKSNYDSLLRSQVNLLSKENNKKRNADLITKRSIELFGLTPEEISDQNEIWMRKKGYKNDNDISRGLQSRQRPSSDHVSRLDTFLKRFRIQKRK